LDCPIVTDGDGDALFPNLFGEELFKEKLLPPFKGFKYSLQWNVVCFDVQGSRRPRQAG